MKADYSRKLYEKYFCRSDRLIQVTLKSGRKIRGVFISFFLNDQDCKVPNITKWHIVKEKSKMTLGFDPFGYLIGEYINQEDIKNIKFLDDNSEMQFE